MLGDCYFLSAISSIAEFEHRIKRLFINDKPNREGVYGVKLFDCGEWKDIIIDDYFPCDPEADNLPAFTLGNSEEIWVMILEKAWAKIHGSYENIEAGGCKEVLNDFTGAPCETIKTGDPKLWPAILTSNNNKWIMTCGGVGEKEAEAAGDDIDEEETA